MLQLRNKGNNDEKLVERNMKLEKLFQLIFPNAVTIIGNPKTPEFIYKNEMLACYVKGDILILSNRLDFGKTLYEVDINLQPDINQFLDWYRNAEHTTTYRIKVKDTPIYLCGMSKYNGNPVFGDLPHYYKTKGFAQMLMDKFSLDYCEIIS